MQGGRDFVRYWMHIGFVNGARPKLEIGICWPCSLQFSGVLLESACIRS